MIAPTEVFVTILGFIVAFFGGLALAEMVERLLRKRGD